MLRAEYIAGFFDGEGSVGLYASRSSKRHALRVCINQVVNPASQALFDDLKATFGGGLSYPKRQKTHHNPAVSWSVYGDEAATFLRWILPHLLLKKEQVELVVGWQEKYTGNRKRQRSPERRLEREQDALVVSSKLGPLKGPRKKNHECIFDRDGSFSCGCGKTAV